MSATRPQTTVPVNAARLARNGDPRALLAIPEARLDIPRLLEGKPAKRLRYAYQFGPPATTFGPRKAITAAKAIVADRQARRAARAVAEAARIGEPGRILRLATERAAARLEAQRQRVQPLVAEAFRGLYRVYESRVRVEFGEPAVNVHTTTKWVSGRGGYGHVTDGQLTTLTVPPTWEQDVSDRDLDYVDGMLTLSAESVEAPEGFELYRAAWVRQGRGYELYRESGCIARHVHPLGAVTTYHSPHADPRRALAGLRRKLSAQAVPAAVREERANAAAAARAAKQAAGIARLVERIAAWDFAEIKDVRVTRADSLRAGNCEPGTDEFIERFFPDRDPMSSATIGEIAARVGRLDPAMLRGADLTLARQLAAAVLQAVRKDRQARRMLAV